MNQKKKVFFILILLTIFLGGIMYYKFSDNNKNGELYNPVVFSFRDKVYKTSDVKPYIKYYQTLTGKNDNQSIEYGLETFIKNEVLYSFINDLKNSNLGNQYNYSVSDKELLDAIEQNKAFYIEKNGVSTFDSETYKKSLMNKGIDIKFFEEQLRKELALGKFLSALEKKTIYNETSKNIALDSTLNTRVVDALKINYKELPIEIDNNEVKNYFDNHRDNYRKESSYSLVKYTFQQKGEYDDNSMKIFAEELNKLDGEESIISFVKNKSYYDESFKEAETTMDLSFSQIVKMLNLGALKVEKIDNGATFIDDSGLKEGVISLYFVKDSKKGDLLTFEESKENILETLKHQKSEQFLYSIYPILSSQDFSKNNEPYLSYERIVVNPLSWKGDDNFLSSSYQLKKGETALARNGKDDLFIKLVNIEPVTLKDEERAAFKYSQEDGYKNFILMTFYSKIKGMYDYKENNLSERVKELK